MAGPEPGKFSGGSAGDGLQVQTDKTATTAALSMSVDAMRKSMGTPKVMAPGKFTETLVKVQNFVGATTPAQKDELRDALVFLGIEHGTGPEVDWEFIDMVLSWKTVRMNLVVDNIITRKFSRRFWANWADRAREMYEANPVLQQDLLERAVRSGLPATEAYYVIDFLPAAGMTPAAIAMRTKAKYSAIRRQRSDGPSSMEESASATAASVGNRGDVEEL